MRIVKCWHVNCNTIYNSKEKSCPKCNSTVTGAEIIYVEIPKTPRIPDFIDSLEKMKELHLKKNEDYATEGNPFANFDFTCEVMTYFKDNRDKTYVWPIACKLARLANLLDSDKPPNNESIEDSFIDIAVYVLLWKADYKRRQTKAP